MDALFDSLLEMLLQECTINAREVIKSRNESRAHFITHAKKAAEKTKEIATLCTSYNKTDLLQQAKLAEASLAALIKTTNDVGIPQSECEESLKSYVAKLKKLREMSQQPPGPPAPPPAPKSTVPSVSPRSNTQTASSAAPVSPLASPRPAQATTSTAAAPLGPLLSPRPQQQQQQQPPSSITSPLSPRPGGNVTASPASSAIPRQASPTPAPSTTVRPVSPSPAGAAVSLSFTTPAPSQPSIQVAAPAAAARSGGAINVAMPAGNAPAVSPSVSPKRPGNEEWVQPRPTSPQRGGPTLTVTGVSTLRRGQTPERPQDGSGIGIGTLRRGRTPDRPQGGTPDATPSGSRLVPPESKEPAAPPAPAVSAPSLSPRKERDPVAKVASSPAVSSGPPPPPAPPLSPRSQEPAQPVVRSAAQVAVAEKEAQSSYSLLFADTATPSYLKPAEKSAELPDFAALLAAEQKPDAGFVPGESAAPNEVKKMPHAMDKDSYESSKSLIKNLWGNKKK